MGRTLVGLAGCIPCRLCDDVRMSNSTLAEQVLVLSCCDGSCTVAGVQALVERDHPALFPTRQAGVSFIAKVLAWDTSP